MYIQDQCYFYHLHNVTFKFCPVNRFYLARNIEILFELFISMYSINNIIYMYTIINVMLFSFSRFERVSNAEQTEQGDSTLA